MVPMAPIGFLQSFRCLTYKPGRKQDGCHILGAPPPKERVQADTEQHCARHVATGERTICIASQGGTLQACRKASFGETQTRHHQERRNRDRDACQRTLWMSTREESVHGSREDVDAKECQRGRHNPGGSMLSPFDLLGRLASFLDGQPPQRMVPLTSSITLSISKAVSKALRASIPAPR